MPGLLDQYLQQQIQQPQQQQGLLGGGLSQMLLGAGAGLLSGQGWGGAAQGLLQGQQMQVAQQQKARDDMIKNLMLRHTLQKDERDYGLRREQFDYQQKQGALTDDLKEYGVAKTQGFTGSLEDWMQRKRGTAGDEYGLTPQWGIDAEGKPVMLQLGKKGQTIAPKLPEGVTIGGRKPIEIDTETSTILLDPVTRQRIGEYPKDIAGKAAAAKEGAATGEARAQLASIKSKMPGLETVVKELDELSNKATFTRTGQLIDATMRQTGMEPRDAAVARARYVAMVDNQILPLLRDTFGAQFTQKEGESLKATLGDPNLSPKEKQEVLRSFIEQKRRDVEALATQAGTPAAAAPAAGGAPAGVPPPPPGFVVR